MNKKLFMTIGFHLVLIYSLIDYVSRDRKWCKENKIGFIKILKNNRNLLCDMYDKGYR